MQSNPPPNVIRLSDAFLRQNWSLVHTIPYYRPQPLLLTNGIDEIKPQSDVTFGVDGGGNNITSSK